MTIYWTLFLTPLLGGLSAFRPDKTTRFIIYAFIFAALTLVIGGRYLVGCDWDTYVNHLELARHSGLIETLERGYPAYSLLNWLASRLDLEIYAVNTACAAIFAAGFIAFLHRQPRPWLVLAASVPYMISVVAMGFTRQATAMGLLMFAFNAFVDRRMFRFLLFVGAAGLFHSSAVAFAPMAIFIRREQRASPLVIGGVASAALVLAILSNALDRYLYGYVEQEYEGEGALYRLPLNALAAMTFLIFRRRWCARFDDGRLYFILSLAALVSLPFAYVLPVMSDRVSMYLLPFQVAVAARLADLMPPRFQPLTAFGVVVAYAVSLYVWMTFAHHASCWIPYSSIYF